MEAYKQTVRLSWAEKFRATKIIEANALDGKSARTDAEMLEEIRAQVTPEASLYIVRELRRRLGVRAKMPLRPHMRGKRKSYLKTREVVMLMHDRLTNLSDRISALEEKFKA